MLGCSSSRHLVTPSHPWLANSHDHDDPDVKVALSRLHVWPLDLEIARASTCLDFRGDPADELIAATSAVHRIPLLTRDRRIRRSKLVPFAT
jgi:PIN domain nuclease of toxin-antitoxin system